MKAIQSRFLLSAVRWMLVTAGVFLALEAQATESKLSEGPILLKHEDLIIPYNLLHISHSWENGRVMVRISDQGEVVDWVPLDLPHYKLLPVLESCVSGMKFRPAYENGEPVDCDVELTILFEESVGISISNQTISDHIESRYAELVPNRYRLKISNPDELDAPITLVDMGSPFMATDENGELLEGTVFVEFYIGTEGRPRMLRIPDSRNLPTEYAAFMTVSSFRFTPPRVRGKPAVMKVRMPVVLAGK